MSSVDRPTRPMVILALMSAAQFMLILEGAPGGIATAAVVAGLDEHRAALTGYCYRMLGSPFDADDAVQETMVRAWRALDRYEGRAAFRTWLFSIATNVCLDLLKGRGRRVMPADLSRSWPATAEPGPALPSGSGSSRSPTGGCCPTATRRRWPRPATRSGWRSSRPSSTCCPGSGRCSSSGTCFAGGPPRWPSCSTPPRWRSRAPSSGPGRSWPPATRAAPRPRPSTATGGSSSTGTSTPSRGSTSRPWSRSCTRTPRWPCRRTPCGWPGASRCAAGGSPTARPAPVGGWCRWRVSGSPAVAQFQAVPRGEVPFALQVLDVAGGRVRGITAFVDTRLVGLLSPEDRWLQPA